MKKLLYCCIVISLLQGFAMVANNVERIGQKYINFLNAIKDLHHTKDMELLFAPTIKKIVNSHLICNDREELIDQMLDIVHIDGVLDINLFELIVSNDNLMHIIRFEITFGTQNTESVISILKCNDLGEIVEINEVFGEKDAYQWPSK